MAETGNVVVGDFVVLQGQFGVEIGAAVKVTNKTVVRQSDSGSRWHEKKHAVLFAGPEAVARRLGEQIASSKNQEREDRQSAEIRHRMRVKAFIAKANGHG